MAHFEVYILNYNGAHYLPRCLQSLAQLDCGEHGLEVSVVDNASCDNSAELVASDFPWVHFIQLDQNYGFSKGNNLGVSTRVAQLAEQGLRADFHVLLNNDTAVDPQWLLAAYEAFANDPTVGVVGSKSVFADTFIPVSLHCENPYSPADFDFEDTRVLGPFLQHGYVGSNLVRAPGRIKFENAYIGTGCGCFLQAQSTVYIPVEDPQRDSWFGLYLENHHPEGEALSIQLRCSTEGAQRISIPAGQSRPVFFSVTPQSYRRYIQNAGSYISEDWYAGDRGFLREDGSAFTEIEDVAAICGVSMFVRAELWEKLAGLDESFFAYYEDTDLSIRAQLLGYRCVYTPHSVLYHTHCGSGVEFSHYFYDNVTWSHLLFAAKHMDARQWRQKLRDVRVTARKEFNRYNADFSLKDKPHLRAFGKYLKRVPQFLKHRIRATLNPRAPYLASHLIPAVATRDSSEVLDD